MKFKKLLALLMALALVLTSFSFAAAEEATEEIVEVPAADEVVEAAEEQAAVEESTDGAPVDPEVQEAQEGANDIYTPTMNVQYMAGGQVKDMGTVDVPEEGQPVPTSATPAAGKVTTPTSVDGIGNLLAADDIGFEADSWYLKIGELEEKIDIRNANAKYTDGATLIFKFTTKEVTVKYAGGGNLPTSKKVLYGAAFYDGEEATKEGADFNGWKVKINGGTGAEKTIAKDGTFPADLTNNATYANGVVDGPEITLTAVWAAKSYDITWTIEPAAELTVGGTQTASANYGTKVSALTALVTIANKEPDYAGKYDLVNSYWTANGEKADAETIIEGQTTIAFVPVVKKYNVKFYQDAACQNEFANTALTPEWGTTVTPADVQDQAAAGKEFDKWVIKVPVKEWDWSDPVKSDVQAYATWKDLTCDVNVYLDETATTPIATRSVVYGGTAAKLDDEEAEKVVKAGYKLDETMPWYTLNDAGQKVPFIFSDGVATNPTSIVKDTNVFANWNIITYTFVLAKGVGPTGDVVYDDGTKDGMAIDKYAKAVEFGKTLTEEDLNDLITTENFEFDGYTVLAKDGTTKIPVTLPLTVDDTLDLTQTKTISGKVTNIITLTGTWSKYAVVSFVDKLNDTATAPAIPDVHLKLDKNNEAVLTADDLDDPDPVEGYEFAGWYVVSGANDEAKHASMAVATNKVAAGKVVTATGLQLFAKWNKVITVKFNGNGGSPEVGSSFEDVELLSAEYVGVIKTTDFTATFEANEKVLPTAVFAGENFDGWYLSNTLIEEDVNIEGDVTLVAKYSKNKYIVHIDYAAGAGLNYDLTDVEEGSKIAKPNDQEYETNVFDNWYLYDTVKGAYTDTVWDFDTMTVTGDIKTMVNSAITIKAKWLPAVAQIDDKYYATLADAFEDAEDDDVVTILAAVKADADLTIDKDIVLDLDGKTINLDGHTLTVKSDVEISTTSTNGTLKNGTLKANGGTVDIESGTFVKMTYEGTGITITDGLFDSDEIGSAVLTDENKKLAQTTASKPYYTPDTFHTLTIKWNKDDLNQADLLVKVGSEETITKAMAKVEYPEITGWVIEPDTTAGVAHPKFYTDAACKTAATLTGDKLTENKTVYVNWQIIVTFDADGGTFGILPAGFEKSSDSKFATLIVNKGAYATNPYNTATPNITKAGYNFENSWLYGNLGWVFSKSKVEEPITLTAVWTRNEGAWTVSEVDESYAGGYSLATAVDTLTLTYKDFDDVTKPLTFHKKAAEDNRAAGYYIKFAIQAPVGVKEKNSDTGFAQYLFTRNGGTATRFNGTGGKYDKVDSETGLLTMYVYERVEFDKLLTSGYEWTYVFYPEATPTNTTTINVVINKTTKNIEFLDGEKLEANKVNGYSTTTVEFEQTTIDDVEVVSGQKLTKPADPKMDDAEFVGWYELNKTNYKFDEDKNAYVKEGGKYVLLDGAEEYDFDTVLFPELTSADPVDVNHEMTLVAEWQETVTLTFMDAGQQRGEVTLAKGATWADFAEQMPKDPEAGTKTIFIGWRHADVATPSRADLVDFTSEDEVAASETLIAWYEQKVTVTFINGELAISEKDYGNNEKRSNVEQPEGFEIGKNGFEGWFEKDAAAPYDFTTSATLVSGTSNELTLFAKFKEEYSTATLKSAKLLLEGKIQIAMKFQLPEDLLSSDIKVVFSNGTEYALSDLIKTSDNMYWFQTPVPIPEFDQDVTVSLKNSKGDVEFKVGGETVTSFAYSVATWINNKKGGTDKDADIAKALEKYGQAAANRFLGGTYSISGLVDVEAEDAVVTGKKPAGITKASQTVNFQEDNSLNVKFTMEDGKKESDYTWTIPTGAKKTVNGQVVTITVPNIAAPNLDGKHTFAVSDGTDTYTIVTSVMTYAKRMSTGKDNPKDPDLMKALYGYCVAAKAYFGQ